MDEKLQNIENRYTELEARMEQPEVYSDAREYAACAKELRELEPVVTQFRLCKACLARRDEALLLAEDAELRALAREEYDAATAELSVIERELMILLLPKDPNDARNVIMEIRGGVGGEEGMLFARDLFRMYSLYAQAKGWRVEIASSSETELGGIKEISFVISGEGAWSRLKYEAGGHRVQRVPVTESGGRIHTSAATVAVLPEVEEVDFHIDPKDLQIDTYRSSGAGGQHVNKTESAIRITHLPTGTVAECQDERSQYKNKDRAMSILRSRLYEAEQARRKATLDAERKSQVGTGDRSDRVRTYNFPQNRVTDHRIEGEGRSFNIDSVMGGNLDPIIDRLASAEQAEKLREQAGAQ